MGNPRENRYFLDDHIAKINVNVDSYKYLFV